MKLIQTIVAIALGLSITTAPAHAELRTLPGGTTQIAVTRIGCSVVIDGQELMNGTCHYRLTDSAGVFMTLPESATQIVVNVSRRIGDGVARLWMQTPDGTQRRENLGGVYAQGCQRRPDGYVIVCDCYANERVHICWTQGDATQTRHDD